MLDLVEISHGVAVVNHRLSSALLLSPLLAALGASFGCADKTNPVIPSTSTQVSTGTTSKASSDAGEAVDASAKFDQATSDANTGNTDAGDAADACDVLKQNCASKAMGCYPVSGAGRCSLAGGVGTLGSCMVGEDPPSCAPGLACIALNSGQGLGACLALCDRTNPTAICTLSSACVALPGFTASSNVGYCAIS